jgi:hypothetical protein
MSKKDFYCLIVSSSVCFLLFSADAFFFSNLQLKYYNKYEIEDQANQQKFEQFAENVKSGKIKLTTDDWIEDLKLERKASESERRTFVPFIEHMQHLGWLSLAFGICNILVIIYARNEINKRKRA